MFFCLGLWSFFPNRHKEQLLLNRTSNSCQIGQLLSKEIKKVLPRMCEWTGAAINFRASIFQNISEQLLQVFHQISFRMLLQDTMPFVLGKLDPKVV